MSARGVPMGGLSVRITREQWAIGTSRKNLKKYFPEKFQKT